jgi:hypothetical protein
MWRWRMEKIIWTDRVKSEEVLQRVKDEACSKGNWIDHRCLPQHVIEGKKCWEDDEEDISS